MNLKSLTYTSFARIDLTADDLNAILRTARDFNALDDITGLLIFNGTHFLQIIEGSEPAIDDLVAKLRLDRRHSNLEVRDEWTIAERAFPGWSMELAHVKSNYFEARKSVAERLPVNTPLAVQTLLFAMTELISGTVEMPD